MLKGGCYCGAVRYEAAGEPTARAECLCRECQYITGGGPNFFMMMPADGFTITSGEPKTFTRSDIDNPVTRLFCPDCGTHLVTRISGFDKVVLKIGSLDDPAVYGGPERIIFACDRQPFHVVDTSLPILEKAS